MLSTFIVNFVTYMADFSNDPDCYTGPWLSTYYCSCEPGYTGGNCESSELITNYQYNMTCGCRNTVFLIWLCFSVNMKQYAIITCQLIRTLKIQLQSGINMIIWNAASIKQLEAQAAEAAE